MEKDNLNIIDIAPVTAASATAFPYAASNIKAGFPSPAEDYLEPSIDLNKELVKHPASTFFGRVSGESMKGAGIEDGDILVIDKSLEPFNGAAAVCFIDGEFTLKYIRLTPKAIWLIPANPSFPRLKITSQNEFIIWGIVTYVIKKIGKMPMTADFSTLPL